MNEYHLLNIIHSLNLIQQNQITNHLIQIHPATPKGTDPGKSHMYINGLDFAGLYPSNLI